MVRYWRRYEIENCIVSPDVLRAYAAHAYRDLHRLVDFIDADAVAEEVSEKLGLLADLFAGTSRSDESA